MTVHRKAIFEEIYVLKLIDYCSLEAVFIKRSLITQCLYQLQTVF